MVEFVEKPEDLTIAQLLGRALRNVEKRLDFQLARFDLTVGQWKVIKELDARKSLRLTDLSRRFWSDLPTIQGIVDRLERKGIVVRTPSPTDRRVKNIELTRDGVELKKQLDKIIVGSDVELTELFSPEDASKLRELLIRIVKIERDELDTTEPTTWVRSKPAIARSTMRADFHRKRTSPENA